MPTGPGLANNLEVGHGATQGIGGQSNHEEFLGLGLADRQDLARLELGKEAGVFLVVIRRVGLVRVNVVLCVPPGAMNLLVGLDPPEVVCRHAPCVLAQKTGNGDSVHVD